MHRRQVLAAGGGAAIAAAHPCFAAANADLRFGLTAVMLADQAAFLARLSKYLSVRAGARVQFSVRDSYQAILDPLFAGDLDAAWICGYPYVREQQRLDLLAVPVYQGGTRYQSYLIRPLPRADRPPAVNDWQDLRGKVFAFSDPLSNSGWLVAQGQMGAAGIRPRDLKRAFFAYGHRHVAEAVAARLADAGSIDGYVWETMRQQGMAATEKTQVVWKSVSHGFPPLVAPSGRRVPALPALRRALLAMHTEPEGRDLLRALNLDGFTPGTPTLFDSIRALARSVPNSGVAA